MRKSLTLNHWSKKQPIDAIEDARFALSTHSPCWLEPYEPSGMPTAMGRAHLSQQTLEEASRHLIVRCLSSWKTLILFYLPSMTLERQPPLCSKAAATIVLGPDEEAPYKLRLVPGQINQTTSLK